MRSLCILAALALACGGSSQKAAPATPAATLDPDVPAWRGGCFLDGPAGKIVNGTPSFDVRAYGAPCSPGGSGGLVYLDGYDPVAGTGDVTLLPSAAGARPIVVAAQGGGGAVVPGSSGARVDDAQARLLTLRDVDFVTGELVAVNLAAPAAAPVRVASGVRVENYDFLPSGVALFVGGYSAATREGSLFLWTPGGAAPQQIASAVSRAEFQLYRLDPARRRIAYLMGWTETGGGDLYVQDLVASPGLPRFVDGGVERAEWDAGGALVWSVRRPDGGSDVRALDPGAAVARALLQSARSWVLGPDALLAVTGWTVLSGAGALSRVGLAPGAAPAVLAPAVAEVAAISPTGALAWVSPGSADRRAGTLSLALPGAQPRAVEDDVAPRAGFSFSPASTFVAYARGWQDAGPAGSASPLPGTGELRVARLAGGAPVSLGTGGLMAWIDWDPQERWVAAVTDYDAAANAGRLRVADPATGAVAFTAERVPPNWFGFGRDGAAVAALADWDDALQRGSLVVQRTAAFGAPAQVVSRDVTGFLLPSGERVIYLVRGGGRDGLWLH